MQRLNGKIAIIAGASRGIGEAAAWAFARQGARVVIASRKQAALDELASRINAEIPGSTFARACHMGDVSAISALVEFTANEVGLPNVLINNAATNPFFGPSLLIDAGAYEKTFEVNVRGYFEASREVAKRLIAAGAPGSIVNVASVAGLAASPFQGVYGMTKAAIVQMTKTMAVEFGGAGIRVNAIAPGLVDTKLAAAIVQNDDLVKFYTERAALKRYGQPEEIAGPLVFLASDESSYITGHTLVVDGGFLAS